MIKRIDFGNRIAGEKAINPDEFTTKSQFTAGKNISIIELPNKDLIFSSSDNTGKRRFDQFYRTETGFTILEPGNGGLNYPSEHTLFTNVPAGKYHMHLRWIVSAVAGGPYPPPFHVNFYITDDRVIANTNVAWHEGTYSKKPVEYYLADYLHTEHNFRDYVQEEPDNQSDKIIELVDANERLLEIYSYIELTNTATIKFFAKRWTTDPGDFDLKIQPASFHNLTETE